MTTKTLRIALAAALIAGASFANAHAASLTTLDTVQVRPAADQIAQQTLERSSGIRTLTAVQVRPTAEQRADLLVHTAAATAQAATGHAAAALGALVGQVIVNLPVPQLQPTPVELEALVSATLGQ
ncbi:hypothetical protein [Xanthomonas campestris]|uniref:hypothetical protein n=1 Tax=Xanthomonas campestris TaxID=339 RepID=UPI000E32AA48|nr:hypothetical protein [Xanthomonas campestris]MEA9576769.1 hypothetical protein [Xanthomonas campestris]MEB2113067.1 hypothetical protein [Xanthomonas campestris pv. campestris]RFF71504.1 hypothetical protein D0A39_10370 [Xanthomonas campestris pv. campestris]